MPLLFEKVLVAIVNGKAEKIEVNHDCYCLCGSIARVLIILNRYYILL